MAFVAMVGGLGILFADAASSMASIWLNFSVYHHGLVVAPISAFLIFRRRDWRDAAPSADLAGAPIIAGGVMLVVMGRAFDVNLFGHAGLVVALIGAAVAVYGRTLARRWSHALLFLFFMVPFGGEATPLLQHWASVAVATALNLSGVDTTRDGFMLTTSAGGFEMAASCAGLRFLIASAMISFLAASLAFANWRKRVAFVAAAAAAALAANWIRAYLIVLITTATERRIGLGPEHVTLGWMFYGALILFLIGFARRFADAPVSSQATARRARRIFRE